MNVYMKPSNRAQTVTAAFIIRSTDSSSPHVNRSAKTSEVNVTNMLMYMCVTCRLWASNVISRRTDSWSLSASARHFPLWSAASGLEGNLLDCKFVQLRWELEMTLCLVSSPASEEKSQNGSRNASAVANRRIEELSGDFYLSQT